MEWRFAALRTEAFKLSTDTAVLLCCSAIASIARSAYLSCGDRGGNLTPLGRRSDGGELWRAGFFVPGT